MRTTKPTNQASLGRAAAAITFTRNNNKQIQPRNSRQATTLRSPHALLRSLTLTLLPALIALSVIASPAQAEPTAGTGWQSFTNIYPTNLQLGGTGTIQIQLLNTGAKPSSGAITVTDVLPEGLEATKVGGLPNGVEGHEGDFGDLPQSPEEEAKDSILDSQETPSVKVRGGPGWSCHGTTVVTCTSNPAYLPPIPHGAGDSIEIIQRLAIAVKVKQGAKTGTEGNRVTVAGGGASVASVSSDPVSIGSPEPGFGFANWDVWFSGADGAIDTQAGSHPYATTFALSFDKLPNGELAGGEARDLEAELPPGFFGEPGATPQCTRAQLDAGGGCPADTTIGNFLAFKREGGDVAGPKLYIDLPVFNMVPPPGVPDEFALETAGYLTLFDAGVSSSGGYNIVTHIDNIPQIELEESILTLWGVSSEASHNADRLSNGESPEAEKCRSEGCPSGAPLRPFLTLPTSCGEAQPFKVLGLSTWSDEHLEGVEASALTHNESDEPTGFTGCEQLSIDPTLSAVPDTSATDTPAGLGVEVKVGQEGLREPEGLVAATLKNTTVALPPGIVINPGQAAGLTACGEAEANIHGEGPANCANSAKVGTVKIQTPLLEGELESELEGSVYVLQSNPPELKLLLAASGDGIFLKLPGTVHLCESAGEVVEGPASVANRTCQAPGQLITTFAETPALPFTTFKLAFSGGAQAALDTPTQCGTYSTASDFTPWTSPFDADVFGSNSFLIEHGAGGGACPSNPLPFTPELIAGATTDQAGGFTNFSLLLRRGDDQQRIDGLQFKAPEGLTGFLSNVPLCTNAQAESNTCPEASKIGHTVVESGPGPYPLVVPEPGQEPAPIYLTEKYDGAPFGLSIVVPLHVGPFTLPTQRVRARIEVNPYTSALTVTTNPLPQEVAGVPTDLREIDSVIERPEFMVNPTNCNPSEFSGTAYGTPPQGQGGPGATAPISSHFQVGSCRGLEFAPKLAVTTQAKTSKADGASLTYKVTYPSAPQGTQSDIRYVKVELPEELPSRLTTLQKACTQAQFQANPAGCPSPSVIGHAKAVVPNIPVPLEGPVYFVSNGGEAFPNLVMVLQGYGVTIDLIGDTLIKNGVTSTTFKAVPDNPLTSFEINLPEGPYSALAANGNLCKPTVTKTVKKKVRVQVKGRMRTVTRKVKEQVATSLTIPSDYIGQNGATYNANVPIAVTGCPKAKVAKKAKPKKKAKHAKKK